MLFKGIPVQSDIKYERLASCWTLMRRWGWIAAARLVSWNCVPMAQAFVLSFTHENCIYIYIYMRLHIRIRARMQLQGLKQKRKQDTLYSSF